MYVDLDSIILCSGKSAGPISFTPRGVTGSSPVSPIGEVVEWFKASVLKTDEVRPPWVRIPPSPFRDLVQFGRTLRLWEVDIGGSNPSVPTYYYIN